MKKMSILIMVLLLLCSAMTACRTPASPVDTECSSGKQGGYESVIEAETDNPSIYEEDTLGVYDKEIWDTVEAWIMIAEQEQRGYYRDYYRIVGCRDSLEREIRPVVQAGKGRFDDIYVTVIGETWTSEEGSKDEPPRAEASADPMNPSWFWLLRKDISGKWEIVSWGY